MRTSSSTTSKGALLDYDLVPPESSELMFQKPVGDDLSMVTWSIFLLGGTFRRLVHSGHKWMDIFSIEKPKVCKNITPTPWHHLHRPELLKLRLIGSESPKPSFFCILMLSLKFIRPSLPRLSALMH
ncbi:hypothetical protein ATANTOWER_001155 [Ataeniobius toweri]|uniref:Uncharacterized protein n=1 Tax=Ataeniobius toweri TaxID=208326 RepID=A0ABU7BE01_9TELE|nr:hypothetical protein [Ataeniobius toweri]